MKLLGAEEKPLHHESLRYFDDESLLISRSWPVHEIPRSRSLSFSNMKRHGRIFYNVILIIFASLVFARYVLFKTQSPPPIGIPPKIWQHYIDNQIISQSLAGPLASWTAINRDYQHVLVSNPGSEAYVRKHFSHRPCIINTFLNLSSPILRSDFFRYLIIESEGGVYSDVDTVAFKPVNDWIPTALKPFVNVIVGLEYDEPNIPPVAGFTYQMQFAQWTMASAPHHSLMRNAVNRVHANLQQLNASQLMAPSASDVLNTTGPAAWTESVFWALSQASGSTVTNLNISGITKPKLFGDILVMPINAFATNLPHSGSTAGRIAEEALINHLRNGFWRAN
ncbi:hypothetical protein MMC09_002123 [Bachmanniomyces sp. S44760]|nr:hypothetical protein [Bachmanniomyces sp. S44760]